MKIVLLGRTQPDLVACLSAHGDEFVSTEDPITSGSDILSSADYIVSYGYRHILKNDVLVPFERRIVNLHISLLPWNRGADPNLWSFLEDTPKGVTIHYIDAGIDTGDIIAQREVPYEKEDTLRTAYDRLSRAIIRLFEEVWPSLRGREAQSVPQPHGGSFHRSRDKAPYEALLTHGWDTPVANLIGQALKGEGIRKP